MKKVLMFMMKSCPHCKNALHWMEEVRNQNPAYKGIEVKIIDENIQPDIASQYDYYYVPTYYIDDCKVHEGVASREIIKNVFDKAL